MKTFTQSYNEKNKKMMEVQQTKQMRRKNEKQDTLKLIGMKLLAFTNMKEIKVKPITNQLPPLSKTVRELLFKNLPINEWCLKQAKSKKL